jgi:hypothetical protein
MEEIFELVVGLYLFLVNLCFDVRDDLRNRDDRGKLKRPSSKYVC